MRIGFGIAAATLVVASACASGSADRGDDNPQPEPSATQTNLGSVSSVTDLKDALVEAGYDCSAWEQDNVVDLAAESGHCGDESVLSTYASPGDLQAQLDATRDMDQLFEDADVERNPNLVGPNWIFNAPDADSYADQLGGTIVGGG